jgi:hypothetical protein
MTCESGNFIVLKDADGVVDVARVVAVGGAHAMIEQWHALEPLRVFCKDAIRKASDEDAVAYLRRRQAYLRAQAELLDAEIAKIQSNATTGQ